MFLAPTSGKCPRGAAVVGVVDREFFGCRVDVDLSRPHPGARNVIEQNGGLTFHEVVGVKPAYFRQRQRL